jgi:hypothetical protein
MLMLIPPVGTTLLGAGCLLLPVPVPGMVPACDRAIIGADEESKSMSD